MSTKPSAFMRRNTVGRLKVNPPARSAFGRKVTAPRPGPSRKSTRRSHTTAPRAVTKPVNVYPLGRPEAINYAHGRGGRYTHKFGKNARLFCSAEGDALIITGVNVKAFIEG